MKKPYRVTRKFGDYYVNYTTQPGDALGNGKPMPAEDEWFVCDCGGDEGARARAEFITEALNRFGKTLPVRS